jgi:hypothetical protein
MSRSRRLDYRGAIHSVRVRGREGLDIFFEAAALARPPKECWADAPRVGEFLRLLVVPLAPCAVRLYGYSVEPNAASVLLQTLGAPLDRFMQRVCGPFSRYWREAATAGDGAVGVRKERPFAGRYESKVIAPEYLPHALRRVHAGAALAGLRRPGLGYPFSSQEAYLGGRALLGLDLTEVKAMLEMKGYFGMPGFRHFMAQGDTPYVANLFEKGSPRDARMVGSRAFVVQALDRAAHPPVAPTRDELMALVASLLRVPPEAIYSATSTGVLGRSLVAWYGVRTGAATLSEIAGWFTVSAATLGRGIRHYRQSAPEHFESAALPGFADQPGTELSGKDRAEC